MLIHGKLALLALVLLRWTRVDAGPPECDPDQVLLQEEKDCEEQLRSNRTPTGPEPEPGRVFRNCTDQGWTDIYPPHDEACEYGLNISLPVDVFQAHRYFLLVRVVYSVGYAISLTSLSIAISVLCLLRRLHCTRNRIHIQLFLSFILRAALILIRDSVLFSSEEHFHCGVQPMGCKLVTALSNYCILVNYSWLLAEGHYLYSLVAVSMFSQRRRLLWYIVFCWGSPLIIMMSWSLARYLYEDDSCWETRRMEWIWWILRLPVLVFITVNLLFFMGIVRILVNKLRTQDTPGTEFSRYRKLAKSSFLLVALLGLHYIIFAFLPRTVSDRTYEVWNSVELAFASTQGFIVAVLYCFLNGEVQNEIQRRWRRWRLMQRLPSRRQCGSMSQSGGGASNSTNTINAANTTLLLKTQLSVPV
uniref:Secretin receptor-like n=1 Tax=Sphaeramia orbicularis TaxID=375764 RepID=A0A672ZYQ7_9TELE